MVPDFAPSVYFRSYLGTNSTFIKGKINRTGQLLGNSEWLNCQKIFDSSQYVGNSDELDKIGKNIGINCRRIATTLCFN